MSPHVVSLPRPAVMERLLAMLVIVSLLLQPIAVLIDSLPHALPRVDSTRDAITITNVELAPSPATTSSAASSSVLRLPSSLRTKDEIPALRTAHSATFDLGNGEFAVLEDATPLHYHDGNGLWQPIDPAFEVNALGWINNTNSLRAALGRFHSRARLGGDGVGVAWTPTALILASAQAEQTIATPRAEGGTALRSGDRRSVRYVDGWSLDGVADQWQSGPGQVEYTMRMNERPAVPFWRPTPDTLDLAVDLTLQDGVVLTLGGEAVTLPLETQEPLVFRGADGAKMILQPPVTYEQDRPDQRVAGSYVLSRGDAPGVIEVRVRTPWSWLAAAERNFPVIVDPMFQMRAASSMLTWRIDPNSGAGRRRSARPTS